MTEQGKFDQLCKLARESAYLKSSMCLLEWDQQTKLPQRGGPFRAETITFMAGEIHKRDTDPQLGELLNDLSASEFVSDPHSPDWCVDIGDEA